MKTSNQKDILKEYDFSKGERGKYHQRYHQRSNVVILEPDMAEAFPNAESVNQALRSIHAISNH